MCTCDLPTCSNWICKQLGEHRIAYKIIRDILQRYEVFYKEGEMTVKDVLSEIESVCETLVK